MEWQVVHPTPLVRCGERMKFAWLSADSWQARQRSLTCLGFNVVNRIILVGSPPEST